MTREDLNKEEREYGAALAGITRRVSEQLGITQNELADQLGVSQGTVCYILNGTRKWPIRQLILVADWMRTTPGALLRAAEEYRDTGSFRPELFLGKLEASDTSFVLIVRLAYGKCSDDLRNLFLTIEMARHLCPETLEAYKDGKLDNTKLYDMVSDAKIKELNGKEHGLSFYYYVEENFKRHNNR